MAHRGRGKRPNFSKHMPLSAAVAGQPPAPALVREMALMFTLGGNGRLYEFSRKDRASESFVEVLRQIGASERTIAAAEGRLAELVKAGK